MSARQAVRKAGRLADGTRFLAVVPPEWNGTLILYSHGPPTDPHGPAWPESAPMVAALLRRGYAIAGCGTDVFYPMEQNLANQMEVMDLFEQVVEGPRRTVAFGESIGGLMTAALVQTCADRIDGALPLCGPLAGAISHWNQDLDCAFVVKTLLAPEAPLDLVRISRPSVNLELALSILRQAQAGAEGRARIALAAAVRQVPGWTDPAQAEPEPGDALAREEAQYRWLEGIILLVAVSARGVLEDRAGGNPSWNIGIDYGDLVGRSPHAATVAALYGAAGLSLKSDLATLAEAPRIEADPAAVDYFRRYIAFDGDLRGTPVLTLHTLGDGLCPVEHEHAYADVVNSTSQSDLLRQLFVNRAGHCSYTPAEVLTALSALEARIDGSSWPDLGVAGLNNAAEDLGADHNALGPAMVVDLNRSGTVVPAAFVDFDPAPFSRAYDARSPH